jgi:hypothetical protein
LGLTPAYIEADAGPLSNYSAVGDGQTTPIGHAAVRFSSVDEEIEPAMSSNSLDSTAGKPQLSGETEAEIRALSSSLHGTHLQTRRMSHFAFEPMSLPVSQVRNVLLSFRLIILT